jgi:hypothetical protein
MKLISTLLLGFLICSCSLLPRTPVRNEPFARWESIFTPMMDKAVELSGMEPLRNKPLRSDEIEIRIWRVSDDLETVVLKYDGEIWKGKHIIGQVDVVTTTDAKVEELPPPKLGWDGFWQELVQLGLLDLKTSYDEDCLSQIDGTTNVVEISKGGTYRIYKYIYDAPNCEDSQKLDLIAEFVGIQFDHTDAECKEAEWFPCSKHLRKSRLGEAVSTFRTYS